MFEVVKSYHVGVFIYAPILKGDSATGRTMTPAVTSNPDPVIFLLSLTIAPAPFANVSVYSLYAL